MDYLDGFYAGYLLQKAEGFHSGYLYKQADDDESVNYGADPKASKLSAAAQVKGRQLRNKGQATEQIAVRPKWKEFIDRLNAGRPYPKDAQTPAQRETMELEGINPDIAKAWPGNLEEVAPQQAATQKQRLLDTLSRTAQSPVAAGTGLGSAGGVMPRQASSRSGQYVSAGPLASEALGHEQSGKKFPELYEGGPEKLDYLFLYDALRKKMDPAAALKHIQTKYGEGPAEWIDKLINKGFITAGTQQPGAGPAPA